MFGFPIIEVCLWILALSFIETGFAVDPILVVDLFTVVEIGSAELTMVTAF